MRCLVLSEIVMAGCFLWQRSSLSLSDRSIFLIAGTSQQLHHAASCSIRRRSKPDISSCIKSAIIPKHLLSECCDISNMTHQWQLPISILIREKLLNIHFESRERECDVCQWILTEIHSVLELWIGSISVMCVCTMSVFSLWNHMWFSSCKPAIFEESSFDNRLLISWILHWKRLR